MWDRSTKLRMCWLRQRMFHAPQTWCGWDRSCSNMWYRNCPPQGWRRFCVYGGRRGCACEGIGCSRDWRIVHGVTDLPQLQPVVNHTYHSPPQPWYGCCARCYAAHIAVVFLLGMLINLISMMQYFAPCVEIVMLMWHLTVIILAVGVARLPS